MFLVKLFTLCPGSQWPDSPGETDNHAFFFRNCTSFGPRLQQHYAKQIYQCDGCHTSHMKPGVASVGCRWTPMCHRQGEVAKPGRNVGTFPLLCPYLAQQNLIESSDGLRKVLLPMPQRHIPETHFFWMRRSKAFRMELVIFLRRSHGLRWCSSTKWGCNVMCIVWAPGQGAGVDQGSRGEAGRGSGRASPAALYIPPAAPPPPRPPLPLKPRSASPPKGHDHAPDP